MSRKRQQTSKNLLHPGIPARYNTEPEEVAAIDRRNCKSCPTYTATQGHGTTQCIPCQQRGLALKNIPPPTGSDNPYEPYVSWQPDLGAALIEDIQQASYLIDVVRAIQILPPHLAATVSLLCVANMSQREIARALHITQQAVFDRIRQAAKIIIKNIDNLAKSPASLELIKKRLQRSDKIH